LLRAVPGMSLDNTFSQVSSASRGGPRAYFRARPPPTASIYFPVGDTSEVKGRTSTRLNLDSTADAQQRLELCGCQRVSRGPDELRDLALAVLRAHGAWRSVRVGC
jgi:hypothetical protein